MAKLLAADASFNAANACIQTHDDVDFATAFDIEPKFRETRLCQVAPVSTTIGSSVNTYAPQGIDGDILKVLWPIDNWLFRNTGFDVLAHHVAYTLCCKDDATRACLSEACDTRLRSIDRILRLVFHLNKSCGRNERLEHGFLGRSGQQRNV